MCVCLVQPQLNGCQDGSPSDFTINMACRKRVSMGWGRHMLHLVPPHADASKKARGPCHAAVAHRSLPETARCCEDCRANSRLDRRRGRSRNGHGVTLACDLACDLACVTPCYSVSRYYTTQSSYRQLIYLSQQDDQRRTLSII